MSSDRFIETYWEEDGSLSMDCERPDGTRYTLLGVELTSVIEDEPDPNSKPITFVVQRKAT